MHVIAVIIANDKMTYKVRRGEPLTERRQTRIYFFLWAPGSQKKCTKFKRRNFSDEGGPENSLVQQIKCLAQPLKLRLTTNPPWPPCLSSYHRGPQSY